MKSTTILIGILLAAPTIACGQKYVTKNGLIRFYSDAPLEKIEAINNQVNAALDTETGEFVFQVLMKSFLFEKALMQDHFNENYIESDRYPNSMFVGKIINLSEINFQKNGSYNVRVEGKLTIHGVTRDISQEGAFKISEGKITARSVFPIKLKDYNVRIPNAVVNNISETIEITVDATLELLNR